MSQQAIDELTMRIENKHLLKGSGYIQFPPQRPFAQPVIVQPPTVSHVDYPEVWGDTPPVAVPAGPPPPPEGRANVPNWRQPGQPPVGNGNGNRVPMAQAPRPAGLQPQQYHGMVNPYADSAAAPGYGAQPLHNPNAGAYGRPPSAQVGGAMPRPGAPGPRPGAPPAPRPGTAPAHAPRPGMPPHHAPPPQQYYGAPPMPPNGVPHGNMPQAYGQMPPRAAMPPPQQQPAHKPRPGMIVAPLVTPPAPAARPAAAPAAPASSQGDDKRSASQKKRDRKKLREGGQ